MHHLTKPVSTSLSFTYIYNQNIGVLDLFLIVQMKEYNIKFGTIKFSTKPILFQKYDWGWGGGGGVFVWEKEK